MMRDRCPTCGQTVLAMVIRGPTAITLCPCGHMVALIDAPTLNPLSPGEWLTEFLADADGD